MTWRNRLFDVVHEAGAITNDAGANATTVTEYRRQKTFSKLTFTSFTANFCFIVKFVHGVL